MSTQKKKSNIFLALLLSTLTALAGSALFGFVYGLGYYIYILAAAEIIFCVRVYLKLAPSTKWGNIAFAILWGLIWTFVFNILAVVICEAFFLAKKLGVSFSNAYNTVIDLWKTNSEIEQYMNKRIFEIAGMILIGGIIYGIIFIANISKAKKVKNNKPSQEEINNIKISVENKPQTINKLPKSDTSTQTITQKLYLNVFSDCKKAILNYAKSKDQETFKIELKEIKSKHLSSLDEKTKHALIAITREALINANSSSLDKKINEFLLKIIK